MSSSSTSEISRLLSAPFTPDVFSELIRLTYGELRRIAGHYLRDEAQGQPCQPTSLSLVHDAFLRLSGRIPNGFKNRGHYFGVLARSMNQALIDRVRLRNAAKRGGRDVQVSLDQISLAAPEPPNSSGIAEALALLRTRDACQAEIVELRFYGGLTHSEIASLLEIGESTVRREWDHAKAWLAQQIRLP